MNEPTPELLTVPEAAAILRMAPNTLYHWSCDGRFPELFVRVPRGGSGSKPAVRIPRDRLNEHIAAGVRA